MAFEQGNAGTDTVTGLILGANTDRIRAFLATLAEQEYSPATMARKIATLRSFHRWLEKRELRQDNPMLLIRTPRQEKRLPKAVDLEQIERLLSTPDTTNLLGARDRAILETLYSTGLRVSELVGINHEDLNVEQREIVVQGKGRKERLVPLGSHATTAILAYLELLNNDARGPSDDDRPTSPLFVNKHGGRLSTRSVRRKVSKYLEEAGLDPKSAPTHCVTRLQPICSIPGQISGAFRSSWVINRCQRPRCTRMFLREGCVRPLTTPTLGPKRIPKRLKD